VVCTFGGNGGGLDRWPNIPRVEAEITAWFEAKNLDDEKVAMRRLNKVALEHVVYAPSSSPTKLGAATSAASCRDRCLSSGASARAW
jgi:hypothetical protein